MGTLGEDCRQAAYQERHVAEGERLELEQAVGVVEHAILLQPHAHPAKSFMPLLREAIPEIVCAIPPEEVQVVVAVATNDASPHFAMECANAIMGAVVEHVAFTGPAYKRPPGSPLALYQLRPEASTESPAAPVTTTGSR